MSSPTSDDAETRSFSGQPYVESSQATRAISGTDIPEFPINAWSRYRVQDFLGKGGMGAVYRAFDPKLERMVAIKVLSSRDPQLSRRFLEEGRAQARVEHEHICKVFEVGEEQGVPFIVMQYIHGKPLHRVIDQMSLEQKLLVMIKVSLALHEAHKAGLVHRDVKPGNIMVARTEDGDFKPFVLDFGLARYLTDGDATMTRSVVGTPGYMAPEQAAGQLSAIGRRVDVYGLGATLYRILGGKAPFEGKNQGQVFLDLLTKDPEPLRKTAPELPPDVETIVMKCLEKRPMRRYESARALADDLQRYLNDDPIQARPGGFWYKLSKKARKQKLAFMTGGIAAVLLVATFSWGAYQYWQVGVRERLAREFTEKVEEIESLARLSYMSPLHDIRNDREMLRNKMAVIATEMEQYGKPARGPGHHALGRGYLVLGALDDALSHLQQAWDSGYRGPEVAYDRGLAMGAMYKKKLDEIKLILDEEERIHKRKDLETTWRDPALIYMKKSRAPDEERAAYLRALIHFYEEDFKQALAGVEQIRHKPWFYEPLVLKGDVYRSRALQAAFGGRLEAAAEDWTRALRAYENARNIAPSDPEISRSLADTIQFRLAIERFEENNTLPVFDEGLEYIREALEIDPDNYDVLVSKARLEARMASIQRSFFRDPNPYLEAAIEAGTRALTLRDDSSSALLELGNAHWHHIRWLQDKGEDAGPFIAKAIGFYERISENHRGYTFYTRLGSTYMARADYADTLNLDAYEAYDRAIDAYQKAVELDGSRISAITNLGICLFKASRLPPKEGHDPAKKLNRAIYFFEKAREQNPATISSYFYLGQSYLRQAREKPELFERALQRLTRGAELAPKMPHFPSVIGEVYHYRGLDAWHSGNSPHRFLDQSIVAYNKAIELSPGYGFAHLNLALVYYFKGKYLIRSGKEPVDFLELAKKSARTGYDALKHVNAFVCEANAWRLEAEYLMLGGRNPQQAMDEADRLLKKVLTREANDNEAHRARGRLYTLKASWLISQQEDPKPAFGMAREHLDTAIESNPRDVLNKLSLVRWCIEAASWNQDVYGNALQMGLRLTGEVQPDDTYASEFMAAKAALLHLKATDRAGAETLLKEALTRNPNLTHHWSRANR